MADSDVLPVVRVEHLTKFYGARRAVDDVSFDMQPGDVRGLLGPNGSGKSTILRILTGYLQPTSGRAQVCGFDVVTQSLQARRCVGYVPEDASLYAHMSVHEFLMVEPGAVARTSSGKIARSATRQRFEAGELPTTQARLAGRK